MDRFEKHFEQVDGIIRHEFVDFIKVNLGSLMFMSCINFIDKGKNFVLKYKECFKLANNNPWNEIRNTAEGK